MWLTVQSFPTWLVLGSCFAASEIQIVNSSSLILLNASPWNSFAKKQRWMGIVFKKSWPLYLFLSMILPYMFIALYFIVWQINRILPMTFMSVRNLAPDNGLLTVSSSATALFSKCLLTVIPFRDVEVYLFPEYHNITVPIAHEVPFKQLANRHSGPFPLTVLLRWFFYSHGLVKYLRYSFRLPEIFRNKNATLEWYFPKRRNFVHFYSFMFSRFLLQVAFPFNMSRDMPLAHVHSLWPAPFFYPIYSEGVVG